MSNHYEDTIWKQITTGTPEEIHKTLLWAIITKIQSESKSQPKNRLGNCHPSCEQSLRRYNLKANHNCAWTSDTNHSLWAIITKIQSESKSQPIIQQLIITPSCEQSLRRYNLKANHNVVILHSLYHAVVSNHYEDTIWKQITTEVGRMRNKAKLWAIITKIQSESKSQPQISPWL